MKEMLLQMKLWKLEMGFLISLRNVFNKRFSILLMAAAMLVPFQGAYAQNQELAIAPQGNSCTCSTLCPFFGSVTHDFCGRFCRNDKSFSIVFLDNGAQRFPSGSNTFTPCSQDFQVKLDINTGFDGIQAGWFCFLRVQEEGSATVQTYQVTPTVFFTIPNLALNKNYRIWYQFHFFYTNIFHDDEPRTINVQTFICNRPLVTSITNSGSPVVCSNTGSALISNLSGSQYSFQWQVRSSGSNAWNNISGAAANSYVPLISDVSTPLRDYRLKVLYQGSTCGATYSNILSVNFQPTPPVLISGGPPIYCAGYPGLLTSSVTAGFTFQWYRDNSPLAVASANTYAPALSGSYFLRISNAFGCFSQSNPINITVLPAVPPSINGLKDYYCPSESYSTLSGTLISGTFSGPGISSGNIFNPVSAGAGTHVITYTGTNYPGCPTTASKKTLVMPASPLINRVISASAVTFSDAWPMDFTSTEQKDFFERNGFENATKGVWRAEESYVYVDDRKPAAQVNINADVNIKTDGTVDNFSLFNWSSALNGGCTPAWRKVNTITQYSPFSYELENKDILNLYSSALYGYRGDLTTAVAANAQLNEIGFDGFEEYTPAQPILPVNVNQGNITVYTTQPVLADYPDAFYKDFEVEVATDNVLTIIFPFSESASLLSKKIKVFGADFDKYDNKNVYGTYTISAVTAHASASKTIVTLTAGAGQFTHTGIWKGKISVPYPVTALPRAIIFPNSLSVSDAKAHTGKNSMLLTANSAELEQIKLSLQPTKKYVLSCWISAGNTDTYTFKSPASNITNKRGVILRFLDKNGNTISSQLLEPSGDVIEGWQRIEEEVVVPGSSARVVFLFRNQPGEVTYFDDIRIFPLLSNIKTYVYNKENYRLRAVLDNNNYATLYYYNEEGNLFLIKKETERGIQTIQESFSHIKE
jgi:hypothetical protein